jgi:hypothetical protein
MVQTSLWIKKRGIVLSLALCKLDVGALLP